MNPIQHLKKFVRSDIDGHAFIALTDSPFQTGIVKTILGSEFGSAFDSAKAEKNSFKQIRVNGKDYSLIVADEYDFTTYEGVVDCVKLAVEQGERVIVFGEIAQNTVLGNHLLVVGAAWYGHVSAHNHWNDALHYCKSTLPGVTEAVCKVA